MPSIGELAEGIGAIGTQIDKTVSEAAAAALEAEDAAALAEELGSGHATSTLDQVQDQLNDLAALLTNASAQAGAIRTLALSAAAGPGDRGGSLHVPAAKSDPAAVPSDKKDRKRSGFSKTMGKAAKKTEDVQDSVETLEKSYQDISDAASHKTIRPPQPPEVTASSTEAASPATGSASTSGVEAPTLAGAVLAVGTAVAAAREIRRRWDRAWKTPEQFPEGEESPPTDR